MNELIDVVTLCAKCLLQFSPKLLNLLCDVEYQVDKWIPFIEVQFGAPKINSDAFQQLSFGTILSGIALLVKVLNVQHHSFKQVPLNQLPDENANDGSETVSMATFSETANQRALSASSPLSPRRPFSKSLSMNSVSSSIVQASNELLSHLDTKKSIMALEFMLTLLASQSLLALKNHRLSSREKQLIRRELSNELYIFHDLVKKKILKDSSKSVLFRPKLGYHRLSTMFRRNGSHSPARHEHRREEAKIYAQTLRGNFIFNKTHRRSRFHQHFRRFNPIIRKDSSRSMTHHDGRLQMQHRARPSSVSALTFPAPAAKSRFWRTTSLT